MAQPTAAAEPYIFLSYAHEDQERAMVVADHVEAAGVRVWVDERSIPGGVNWDTAIVRGIRQSAAMLVLCSEEAMHSVHVQQELRLALQYGRPMLPLLIEPCTFTEEVEYALAGRQWVEVLDRSERTWLPDVLRALGEFGIHGRSTGSRLPARQPRSEAPPAIARVPAPEPRSNLPVALSSFIGRERELAEVAALHAAHRLVTLSGPGGAGKTRLALELARAVQAQYDAGVCWVELAALGDPALLPATVAAAMGLREETGRAPLQTLIDALSPQALLLVLDNCEHLVEACARLTETLLRACPDLHVLTTSREALEVTGEAVYRVPSLSQPRAGVKGDALLAALRRSDAARLFEERARGAQPGFTVSAENAEAVASIARRLDGLPFALELAAARTKMLSLDQIVDRLDDRFRLLTGGSRTALRHQQTLRTAMDWSHALLRPGETTLLRRLAVFSGGFTLEAVERVCVGQGLEAEEMLDALTELVDKSLVVAYEQDGANRYVMLETVRQYAAEKLAESGEEHTVRDAHLHWYLALAEATGERARGPGAARQLARLDDEHDNLRAALMWCGSGDDPAGLGLRLAVAMEPFWQVRASYAEGARWLERFLAAAPRAPAALRARGLHRAGSLAFMLANYPLAAERLAESLTLYQGTDDRRGATDAHFTLAQVVRFQGDHERAVALFEESLARYRELHDRRMVAQTLRELGVSAGYRGDLDHAVALCEESLSLYRQLGDQHGTLAPLVTLARIAMLRGEHGKADGLFEEGLRLSREAGDTQALASVLADAGTIKALLGAHAAALTYQRESLMLARDAGLRLLVLHSLTGLAATLHRTGQAERAVRLYAAAAALREGLGVSVQPAYRTMYEDEVRALRTRLGEATYDSLWSAGRALTAEAAIAEALDEHADA